MDKKPYERVGLTFEEYERIVKMLGREPNGLELNLYGVMWSEHCSYKNSKQVLRVFPTSGDRVLQGPGENAGIVDIGDGLAVVMKIESHNHPSAVEPYQGAATGAGGIIRDIFTMGARPVALLNSLRFGELESDRTKYLFENAVAGIGGYGNCIGIPTVGGEVYFNDCYRGNPLVNAMCVGIIRHGDIKRGTASGAGNAVMIVGASTGRDGMGGASFASVELNKESQEKRSPMQVGDPFLEKLLLEACLELFETGCVVGVQDLGAAGLTSASSETASRGGSGMDIDVSLVPRRETGMVPVEVMISESQERMLVIVEKGREEEVTGIFKKWGLNSSVIGRVTDDGMLTIRDGDEVVGSVPAKSLAEDAPIYYREYKEPSYLKQVGVLDERGLEVPDDLNGVLVSLLKSPNIASKEWAYRQFDYMVRTCTAVTPGSDAAVVRIRGTNKAIALTADCNSRYCYLDPATGGAIAVAEAARNLVCSGAQPLAATDCLNFGNPEKPGVFWQFRQAVSGMSEACRALDTPVISGNVSFYNETDTDAVFPTPVVGMVGVVEDISHITTQGFKEEGDVIVLLGENTQEAGGSEYLKVVYGLERGSAPKLDLDREKRVQGCCLELIRGGTVKSAHDCSEGGIAVALAESCISGEIGAKVELEGCGREDLLLFGEGQSRIVITVRQSDLERVKDAASRFGIPVTVLGRVRGKELIIDIAGQRGIQMAVKDMETDWREAIECIME
ncbi:MAG: phosphoribosylformylglycinamidine synthase subunit PurL [Firmicutes bacterium]|nr:phosphoribosylformylglycinamidine synthase subunit PurL [Bacillota bacterium]MDD4707123.1 phosphoribosylformylglycinamidine synthase subunit PurL [Bacillota bacterium]